MEQTQLQATWEQILKKLEDSLSQIVCENWLRPLVPVSLSTTTLELGTPTDFSKEWIEKHYIPFIIDASYEVTQAKLSISIKSLHIEEADSVHPLPQTPAAISAAANADPVQPTLIDELSQPQRPAIPSPIVPGDSSSLNPKYVFETFVTGNSNRFAHAAAR